MTLYWEDAYHDATKIDTITGLIHDTDAGMISANPLLDSCDMESLAEIDAFFNEQILGTATRSVDNTGVIPVISGYSPLKIANPKANSCYMKKNYKDGGGAYISGWKNFTASVWLYVNASVRDGNTKVYFTSKFRPDPDVVTSGNSYDVGFGFDSAISGDNILYASLISGTTTTYSDSGYIIPLTDTWIKLSIEKTGDTVKYYVNEIEITGMTLTLTNQLGACEVSLAMEDSNAPGGSFDFYWDMCEIKINAENNNDDTNYPGKQHYLQTIDIEPSELLEWDKIDITKINQNLDEEQYITCSVLDPANADTVITGFDGLTDDEIDISDITQTKIAVKLEFYDVNGYPTTFEDTVSLANLRVYYNVDESELTLSVTENTYNDDLTPPIVTKTGYRVKFKAVANSYYDTHSTYLNDPDVYAGFYWFDFGEGLNTGWIESNIVTHIFNKHSLNVSEAGADQQWQVRCKIKWSNGIIGVYATAIDVSVLNANPVARIWCNPRIVRMSGAPLGAIIKLDSSDSFDIDDNGVISTSGGYLFDLGDGTAQAWQVASFINHSYDTAGTYVVGITVKDDIGASSTKLTTKIKILDAETAKTISFNRHPSQVTRSLSSGYNKYHTISGGWATVEGIATKDQQIKISGQAHLVETDITNMSLYVENQTLITFQYYDLTGALVSFTGYIVSFQQGRVGGMTRDVPWTATIQYKDV